MAKTAAAREDAFAMISTLALAFPVVSSLEAGLRADCVRLTEFEAELTRALEGSYELANVRGSPADWDTGCHHHWDHVMAVLRRIHRILAEMHDAVGNSHPHTAYKCWEELQHQEARLAIALSGLRDQAAHLDGVAADDWKKLLLTIESHRKAVQLGIQGLHHRLQFWASQSPQDIITDEAPIAIEDIDEHGHQRELDQAAIDIHAEQHQELGLLDGLKALFMWEETPGERVRKKHHHAAC
jgi:hypothetical protein